MSTRPLTTRGRTLDYAAGVYDILSPLMTFGQERRFARKVIDLLDLKGEETLLDVGCGTGTLSIALAERLSPTRSRVVGLDAAPRMIDRARRKATSLPSLRFDVAVAEELPYDNDTFDGAVSTFFFHHVDMELKKQILRELHRVLRANAPLVVVDVDVPTSLFGMLCAWSGYVLFRQEEIRENMKGMLRLAFAESGFGGFQIVSTHLGYISIFKMVKCGDRK